MGVTFLSTLGNHKGCPYGIMPCFSTSQWTTGGTLSSRGEDGFDQRFGIGCGVFLPASQQVVVGRTQWEEPVTGVYYPTDEGLDVRQRLVVGLGDEPALAKVPTEEVEPIGGQFAGQFPLKGADASTEGVYFTSHDAQLMMLNSPDDLFAG